jgi:hypothetical protein
VGLKGNIFLLQPYPICGGIIFLGRGRHILIKPEADPRHIASNKIEIQVHSIFSIKQGMNETPRKTFIVRGGTGRGAVV